MNHFFGTFISGTGEIVVSMLEQRLKDWKLLSLLDGAVEFETNLPYSDLNLFCFNNLFQVLHRGTLREEENLDLYLKKLLADENGWADLKSASSKIRTFRLVTSRQNKLVSVDASLREQLEKRLMKRSGLRVNRSKPDTEFWVLSRSEGVAYFLQRLSKHMAYDKLLDPGELHPELAYMMCWLTSPKYTDVVLDPFCGYGAVPLQRSKRFPFEKLYAFDLEDKPLARTKEKLPRKNPHIIVERHDALMLEKVLPPASVDAVITDPPWGVFREVGMELGEFYRRMLLQFKIVLKPGGRLVLLTAAGEELSQALAAVPGFALRQEYHILVSGKKSGLYLLEKG